MSMTNGMTPRERLLTTLRGEVADRAPISPFVQDEYLAYYYPHKSSVDRVIDAHALAEELDFDLIAKHRVFEAPHFLRKNYPNWEVRRSVERADGMVRVRLEIVTPRRTLVQEEAGPDAGAATTGIRMTPHKQLLSEPADIEAFLEFLPRLDDEERRKMRETARAWRAVMGERGVLAPWGWGGVFNCAVELRGVNTLLTEPYLNEPFYRDFMSRLTDAIVDYNLAIAETDVECVGLQGNMGNGALLGPDFFRSYVQPYEQRVLDAIHGAGKFTVYHNCGCAKALYSNYAEMRMTVWETVSEKPQGDNNLAEAKAALGDKLVLLGNLDQVYFLKTATPEEVAERTRRTVEIGKPGGRYIFSTSDFLEKNTPRDNVVAMIEAAREAGRY